MTDDLAPNDVCIFSAPRAQFAIDLVEGWTSRFPASVGVEAGEVPLFDDPRSKWAISMIKGGASSGVQGMRILELGPLEGAHTYMLEQAGAESITAIEANKRLFLKCLITKEIVGLSKSRFLLGDFMPWLEAEPGHFDLVWCTGVLYHMPEPLKLLHAIARTTDRIHIWTHYVDDQKLDAAWASPIVATDEREFMGRTITHYRRSYHSATSNKTYCGGVYNEACWLSKESILEQLKIEGFYNVDINFDIADNPNGPCFALVAQR
jgi:SAM-dependent methyltransferase